MAQKLGKASQSVLVNILWILPSHCWHTRATPPQSGWSELDCCQTWPRYYARKYKYFNKVWSRLDRTFPRRCTLPIWHNFYFAPGGDAKYCDQHVCVSVCLLTYLKQHTYKFHPIFRTCYLWPWLGPPLMEMWHVMYFRFCGWRHVFT